MKKVHSVHEDDSEEGDGKTDVDLRQHIGQVIARLRNESGLSQSELGRISGISHSTISRLENGEFHPRIDVLLKLVRVFRTSIDHILGFDEADPSVLGEVLSIFESETVALLSLMRATGKRLSPGANALIRLIVSNQLKLAGGNTSVYSQEEIRKKKEDEDYEV